MKIRPLAVLATALATAAIEVAAVVPAHAAPTDPVTDLEVTQVQVGQQEKVTATWTPNDGEGTTYRMSISDHADGSDPIARIDRQGASATITTDVLAPGSAYYVVVQPRPDGVATSVPFTALDLDTTGPTGTYTVDRTKTFLLVDFDAPEEDVFETAFFEVTQTSLTDDSTAADDITRAVDQGDGTPLRALSGTGGFRLRYTRAGIFAPKVHLTDAFGNTSVVPLPVVQVVADRTPPRIRITLPANPSKVASWRRVQGTVTDAGTGVEVTMAFVCQKRGKIWFSYDFGRRKWLKGRAGLTRTIRESDARPAIMRPSATGAWRTPLIRGLRTGPFHVETFALDKNENGGYGPIVNRVLR